MSELAAALDALAPGVSPAGPRPVSADYWSRPVTSSAPVAEPPPSALAANNPAPPAPADRPTERAVAKGCAVAWAWEPIGQPARWQYGLVTGHRKRDGVAWVTPLDRPDLSIRLDVAGLVVLTTPAELVEHLQSVHAAL